MGSNQYWTWKVYDLCVYYMTGTPEGSTKSGFMEKPGIEPATPGLQDIGFSPIPRRLHLMEFGCFPLLSSWFISLEQGKSLYAP